jgi:hypothetical protein
MRTAKRLRVAGTALALLLALLSCGKKEPAREAAKPEEKKEEQGGEKKKSVAVRTGIDHSAWDRLAGKYVDGAGLVAYERWKSDAKDREALKSYLEQFAAKPESSAAGNELGASLTNAYNALTVSWVLENFPTESIRALKDSFTEARHSVGGEKVSLDDIEHGTLRPKFGYRVHGAVSCASLSCPPLSSDAYTAEGFEGQLDAAMRRWLARGDLNRFLPAEKKVEISEVFKWFLEDFQKAGGLGSVLRKYAPAQYRDFLAREDYEIEYLSYDWGLNDEKGLGKNYSRLQLLKDKVKEKL